MSQEDSNEGLTAQRQLNKLKEKHGIPDWEVCSPQIKEIFRHDKTKELSSIDEIVFSKLPTFCGNELIINESASEFVLKIKGNDVTFSNSDKLINFILLFVDDVIEELKLLGVSIDLDSVKVGMLITIINELTKKIKSPKIFFSENNLSSEEISYEEMIKIKRKTYDAKGIEFGSGLLDIISIIPIINYVKEITKY